MASKVSIELDLSVVQEAIHAKVRPAVDAILAKYDLPELIAKKLDEPLNDARSAMFGGMVYDMMVVESLRRADKGVPIRLIDKMLHEAICKLAEDFVKQSVESERGKIEAAFKRMMKDSPDKLVKIMLKGLDDAMANGWSFDFAAKVTAKEPERDYD